MSTSRRNFFRGLGLVLVAPIIAKASGLMTLMGSKVTNPWSDFNYGGRTGFSIEMWVQPTGQLQKKLGALQVDQHQQFFLVRNVNGEDSVFVNGVKVENDHWISIEARKKVKDNPGGTFSVDVQRDRELVVNSVRIRDEKSSRLWLSRA